MRGQSQGGIDIFSALGKGRYGCYQCKLWESFEPSDVANAVDAFLKGGWREKTDEFVLCVTVSFADTALSDAVESLAVAVHAVYLAGHEGYEAGERLLRPYGNALWAATTRLRVAMAPNAPGWASLDAARKLLSLGPPPSVRVEAAQGLARGGDFHGAREHLLAVARDPGGPPGPRTEAYDTLMRVVGNEQADWTFAQELYDQWSALAPGDPRAAKWGPAVFKRRDQ